MIGHDVLIALLNEMHIFLLPKMHARRKGLQDYELGMQMIRWISRLLDHGDAQGVVKRSIMRYHKNAIKARGIYLVLNQKVARAAVGKDLIRQGPKRKV